MSITSHWQQVYETKPVTEVSWFQDHADRSLSLIRESSVGPKASIIDVGGGASTLVDDLLLQGFGRVTVLDVADAALEEGKRRLGLSAARVAWIVGDITVVALPESTYDFWHDRAVFHFLVDPSHRAAYVAAALRALRPSGYLMVATFADDGPTRCSGLPTMRYSGSQLHAEFGSSFQLIKQMREIHQAPSGTAQAFTYCLLRKGA